MNPNIRQAATYTAVSGFVMLLYGGYLFQSGFEAMPGAGALYGGAVQVFKWTLLIGGMALLLAAALCITGLRKGLMIDAIVSGLSGGLLVGCAGIWVTTGKRFDLQDVVIGVFGLILLREALASWKMYQTYVPTEQAAVPIVTTPSAAIEQPIETVVAEEPPDGYLAALGKQTSTPPDAS